jgi:XTP/dITP diphosphohydrolase
VGPVSGQEVPREVPAGRVLLLVTSPRVAPGLLSWPAWGTVHGALAVLTREPDHPQRPYVEAAGAAVTVVAGTPAPVLAHELVESARAGDVVLLAGPGDDADLAGALAAEVSRRAERGEPVPEVEMVPGSWDVPGSRLLDLVAVMDRLRSPGGCPWDAEQTHESLLPYLLEETYETVEAVESGDRSHLREELGDLLLQVAFHARVAEEHPAEPFSVDDVAAGIVEKLVRRHPHVFAAAPGTDAPTAEHVEASWEVLKAAEKQRTSVLEGVPVALPALTLAAKYLSRAAKGGVSVPVGTPPGAVDVADADALGETLLALVAAAREAGVDAEAALRGAVRRWAERVRAAESA